MRDELLPAPMLIKRAIEEARAVSKGKHRFEHDIDTNALLIGGEVEFYSIIVNLITNAVRYTPEGGVIRVNWQYGDEGVRFAVADTGIGIDRKSTRLNSSH